MNPTDILRLWQTFLHRYSKVPHGMSQKELISLLIAGKNPVIFTAPHAVRHLRSGTHKKCEIGTGALAEALAVATDSKSLSSLSCEESDPNWDSSIGHFKEGLLALGLKGVFVIDLHGMQSKHGPDICIGLGMKPGKAEKKTAELAQALAKKHKITLMLNVPFNAKRKTTITSFVQSCGGSALQVEISKTLRSPSRDPELAKRTCAFLFDLAYPLCAKKR